MSEIDDKTLRQTLLHDWHVGHGARMVAFGGWRMPLQYGGGVVREHIATRTAAGLFDVCHMGRFRFSGRGAQEFLAGVLSNDVDALAPGQAQYTFIANERGGAIDDAYLYRLGPEDFLLVVNASNRARDWSWLEAQPGADLVQASDQSEAFAMFALQGPRSEALLAAAVGSAAQPEARRNRLRIARYDGHALIVARTGYTGEAVGFELFVDAQVAVALWQRLIDAGAVAAGLGARDSLRLEAGLPLYGHELGCDRDGREIPIFANRLARHGVRKPGRGKYVGVEALDAQRAEYDALVAGAMDPEKVRWLHHLIQPLAAFDSRRPLRAGYDLFRDGAAVGYVTSGSSVPILRPGPARGGAEPAKAEARQYEMRPVGLALVRSDIRYRADAPPVRFEVRDARQLLMHAHLVERNLPPAAMPPA